MQATVIIKGQPHEVYFGLMSLEIFVTEQGSLEQGSILHIGQITSLVWAGLKNAAFRNRTPFTLAFADVADEVEKMYLTEEGQKQLGVISQTFSESQAIKGFTEKNGEKKKAKRVGK